MRGGSELNKTPLVDAVGPFGKDVGSSVGKRGGGKRGKEVLDWIDE